MEELDYEEPEKKEKTKGSFAKSAREECCL